MGGNKNNPFIPPLGSHLFCKIQMADVNRIKSSADNNCFHLTNSPTLRLPARLLPGRHAGLPAHLLASLSGRSFFAAPLPGCFSGEGAGGFFPREARPV